MDYEEIRCKGVHCNTPSRFCEHRSEFWGFINSEEVLNYLSDYQILRKVSHRLFLI